MSWLFYGAGAKEAALNKAQSLGGFLCEPLEELPVGKAREVVSLLRTTLVGDEHSHGVIVIGPIDQVSTKASDVLLKTLEEPHPNSSLVLWARDKGSVRPTIESRCFSLWAGGKESLSEVSEKARVVFAFILNKTPAYIPHEILSLPAKTEREFLEAFVSHMPPSEILSMKLWASIRILLTQPIISKVMIISCLLSSLEES